MKNNFNSYTETLAYWAVTTPNKIAYTFLKNGEDDEVHLTYAELHIRAKAIAATLQMITKENDRVILLYPSSIEFIEAFFGCLYAGLIAVPVDHKIKQNPKRLLAIFEDSTPSIVLTTQKAIAEARTVLGKSFNQVKWQASEKITNNRASFWKPITATKDTIAFLQYTSGSTSAPKGVMASHGNLLHQFEILQASAQAKSNDNIFTWLPLYHDMGLIGNILFAAYYGGRSVFMSPISFLKKPVRWLKAISKYKISLSGAPNFAYNLVVKKTALTDMQGLDLSHWKVAFCGAEPIRENTLQRFLSVFKPYGLAPSTLFPCYGLAEAMLMVTASGVGNGIQSLNVNERKLEQSKVIIETNDRQETRCLVSSGQPILSQKVRIVEPNIGAHLNDLEIGEVWISGDHIAKGYWNKPILSQEKLHAKLENEPHHYLKTGDLGFMHQGELYITGRIKDLIKIRGRGIYPQDIEYIIQNLQTEFPEIKDVGVFGFEQNKQERIASLVEIKPRLNPQYDPTLLTNQIMTAISDQFEITLADIVLIKSGTLPKTTSGKIQRYKCREQYLSKFKNQLSPIYQMKKVVDKPLIQKKKKQTSSKIQFKVWLIEWVAKELEVPYETINSDESLINYGLESLSAVSLADTIEQKLQVEVSSTLAHDFKTIDEIVEHLEEKI